VNDREQGTPLVVVVATTVRINPRLPVRPALEKGRVTEVTAPAARVYVVALPMVVPAALMKLTVPVQEAAVVVEVEVVAFDARLIRLTPRVSVLANPTRGNVKSEV
jgi:hypothetical protein